MERTQEQMEERIKRTIHITTDEKSPGVGKMFNVSFVSCKLEKKSMCVEFPTLEWELNPQRTLHGGLISTFFDTAYGFLISYFFEKTYICTVDMSTNYIKSANEGDSILVEIKINSIGNTITTVYGEARRKSDSVLIATSTATFMAVRSKAYVVENGSMSVKKGESAWKEN